MSSLQVQSTLNQINNTLKNSHDGPYKSYSCKTVSWDDVQRGTVGESSINCWGSNITDTRLYAKDGRQLFTVRGDNWNERLGKVSSSEVALVATPDPTSHSSSSDSTATLRPFTLRGVLSRSSEFGKYVGLKEGDLSDDTLDKDVSIRFQTTFLPVEEGGKTALEFAPEAYNYNTRNDNDPRNLILLCTSQGLAIQQDGFGSKKLYHHAVDTNGSINRHWLEAESSNHKVGGSQVETKEEKEDAIKRGKATSSVIGVKGIGTRFNVLMTIQVPLKQKPIPEVRAGTVNPLFSSTFYSGVKFGSSNTNDEFVPALSAPVSFKFGSTSFGGGNITKAEIEPQSAETFVPQALFGSDSTPFGGNNINPATSNINAEYVPQSTPVSFGSGFAPFDGASNINLSPSNTFGSGSASFGGSNTNPATLPAAATTGLQEDWVSINKASSSSMASAPTPFCNMTSKMNYMRSRSSKGISKPFTFGKSSAARVSRGSYVDTWKGLTVKEPKRHENEHITATIVLYYTCAGGVPTEQDVKAAIDDLEELYQSVETNGRLSEDKFNFMKSELTVKNMVDIETKLVTQPPPPKTPAPVDFDVFPS